MDTQLAPRHVDRRFAFWRGWLVPCTDASWATFAYRIRDDALWIQMRPFAARWRWVPIAVVSAAIVIVTWTVRPDLGFSRLELITLATVAASWIGSRLFPGLSRVVVLDRWSLRVRDAERLSLWTFASCDLSEIAAIRASEDAVVIDRRDGRSEALPLGPLSRSDAELIADILGERLAKQAEARYR